MANRIRVYILEEVIAKTQMKASGPDPAIGEIEWPNERPIRNDVNEAEQAEENHKVERVCMRRG